MGRSWWDAKARAAQCHGDGRPHAWPDPLFTLSGKPDQPRRRRSNGYTGGTGLTAGTPYARTQRNIEASGLCRARDVRTNDRPLLRPAQEKFMARKLEGKVIIVTGGSSGIGRAAALRCGADGAAVVVADVNAGAGEATARDIEHAGGRACFLRTDVVDNAQVQALVATTVERYGKLDGAFNNAGIEGGFANTVKMSEEAFDRTIAVNLKGVWLCLKHQIEQFLAQGSGGAIVNTASVAGLVGTRGGIAYSASKHAVVGMTRCAALDFSKKRIRVNAVCPGIIHTPMLERMAADRGLGLEAYAAQEPVGRLGEPREIGDAVAWLLSDEASFVTGIALPVDGGWTAV